MLSPQRYPTGVSMSMGPNTTGYLTTGESREVERRQASSVVLKEEYLGVPPKDEVTYVNAPQQIVEEVITRIPKREVIEVEKVVPRYEYEWVERTVEVPQVHYIDRQVEVEQIQYVDRAVPRHEVVEVPKEVVRHVPRVETVHVEKVVEVPGEIIEVPKPYVVENRVPVPRYVDNEVAMVVAQTIQPVIAESTEAVEVDVFEYEPQVVVIDVHVPKPVPSQLIASGMVEERHRLVTVPAAQYNSMLKVLNTHIQDVDQRQVLPFVEEAGGVIPMLGQHEASVMYPAPIPTARIEKYVPGSASTSVRHLVQSSSGQVFRPMSTTASTSPSMHYPARIGTRPAETTVFGTSQRITGSPTAQSNSFPYRVVTQPPIAY